MGTKVFCDVDGVNKTRGQQPFKSATATTTDGNKLNVTMSVNPANEIALITFCKNESIFGGSRMHAENHKINIVWLCREKLSEATFANRLTKILRRTTIHSPDQNSAHRIQ
jgi:hypothetical protein